MATPKSVRYMNEIRALNALFRHGGMSRADLARVLGLNRSTTGNIIANLRQDALVSERPDLPRGAAAGRTGRPGIHIELDPEGARFLGAEIGVDRLTVLAIDMAANEIARQTIAFPTFELKPEAVADRLAAMVLSLDLGPRIGGLCVALPALLDAGRVINALMIGWQDVPMRDLIRGRIAAALPDADWPVEVENDANAFAIAETYRDASKRTETVAVLLIENGAGGGIVIGGRLFRGAAGLAGEFGQIVQGGDGFAAGRPKPGHLESYIGKDALLARYRGHGGAAAADLERLLAALDEGDLIARRTALDWGRQLALGLVQIASVLNPGAIVLGGTVAPVFRHVAAEVEAAMRREFLDGFPMPRLEVSTLGLEGAALGSALLMHQRMFSIDERAIHAGDEPITLFRS